MNFVQNICRQRKLFKNINYSASRILLQHHSRYKMSHETVTTEFVPAISLATPLEDYKKLVEEKMQSDELLGDDLLQENYAKIAEKMREVIWKLLFTEKPPKPEDLRKAGECLREHKSDACFYTPYDYNDWIPKVRDELLKREMLDFWREYMVKRELGPCWAKDSDYFSDIEDEEPEKFYKHAGCVAPFSKEAKKQKIEEESESEVGSASQVIADTLAAATTLAPAPIALKPANNKNVPAIIGVEKPCEDYKLKLEHQLNLDADDEEALKLIFDEVRKIIWTLLFDESPLTPENYTKAADTLEAYKRDACFFYPWDYNDWIPKVRDELFKRKYFDFWQQVIVERKLGLCWYKDSDCFDDCEDEEPLVFYKSGIELMKQVENK